MKRFPIPYRKFDVLENAQLMKSAVKIIFKNLEYCSFDDFPANNVGTLLAGKSSNEQYSRFFTFYVTCSC
jgi:hypothetical protein